MNKKNQPSKILIFKKLSDKNYKFILNGLIAILVLLIIIIGISLILKLKNLDKTESNIYSNKNNIKPVQVEVLNGCGINGAADKITDLLRNKNYDVVQMGNYNSFDIYESIVIDRKGDLKIAKKIASSLGISNSNVIQQINKKYLLDVSVIVGKDYKKLIE